MNANAINIMGMGSWRLKPVAAGPIQMLVANIEGGWRHLIDDLHLYSPMPRVVPEDTSSVDCMSECGQPSAQTAIMQLLTLMPPPVSAR